jgi:hypothetical protein
MENPFQKMSESIVMFVALDSDVEGNAIMQAGFKDGMDVLTKIGAAEFIIKGLEEMKKGIMSGDLSEKRRPPTPSDDVIDLT